MNNGKRVMKAYMINIRLFLFSIMRLSKELDPFSLINKMIYKNIYSKQSILFQEISHLYLIEIKLQTIEKELQFNKYPLLEL